MAEKKRIDVYLFENGFAESREKAKALVIAGAVYVDGQRCDRPSSPIGEGQVVTVKKAEGYVSRGGKKLEKALECFDIDIRGITAVDVGASTGGFTDCMLQHGAEFVYAVDVGHGQLAWSLRQDSRVCVMEHCNARYLKREMFDKDVRFASIDVSFISLKLILPALIDALTAPFGIVALIKPQFEAGRENVGKKGVVRDKNVHENVIAGILEFARGLGLAVCGLSYSPIKGPEGNIEYLAYFKSEGESADVDIKAVVEQAHINVV
ncbi:MAG: TlyA family RNA methyltransferase [Burkholderiales bacterium]